MTAQPQVLKIRRPDDWHIHLRDDEMLKTVVPYTSQVFGRAIVMPNLVPRNDRGRRALPRSHSGGGPADNFTPLMTCYLTNSWPPVNWSTASSKGCLPPPSCIRPTLRPTPATASAT